MDTAGKYRCVLDKLKRFGQEQVFGFYDELDSGQKDELLGQVGRLDFEVISGWVEDYVKNNAAIASAGEILPADYYPAHGQSDQQRQKYDAARKFGAELIAAGKVAAFTVAGGQGTRLGIDGPKGDYPVSPVRNKTLFQIFAESILAVGEKYGVRVPWYVMTSPLNHEATVGVFEANGHYGLKAEDVFFFEQGTNPNFDADGKILLADKGCIASSPDGHGGSLKAIYKSGALADMQKRGVEYISYFQVDNPIVSVVDPLFIGLHAMEGAEMSSKALKKAHAFEKVGNFCIADGKMTVIEYSDLSDADAKRENADGTLMFELGSIAIHVINTAFVEKLNKGGFMLPMHRALKKISHIDAAGKPVSPAEPNGVKLETFVFDALPLAEKSIILETLREEEFAPVKNADGDDSPEVTRRMMVERAGRWLEKAGAVVPRKANGAVDCVIEIAAGFAVCAEDVAEKIDQVPAMQAGDEVYIQ